MDNVGDGYISIRGVSKMFGSMRAVDDVSVDIRRGEFFSLLGPSGCGKTTLLRMIGGFEFPTAGEIVLDGQQMATVPPNRRPVNMVFQSYAIFPHLTVAENIAYGLRKKGLSKAEVASTVGRALERIKLADYGHRTAQQLSGGQRQRVALARALVCEPKVLLLDEPLAALDKRLREQMQIELRELQRSVGITFVLVTHDQEEALALSDRIAVMSRGRVLQIDQASQLYETPNCQEVARFIGTMNFFGGTVLQVDGKSASIHVGPAGNLRVAMRQTIARQGDAVTIAVRPERIRLDWTPPENGGNVLEGHVGSVAY
ncbi:MAG: ABC transporter ATP-binding protein, partial [Rhizobiaceae bacterium]|nr:ABC transporter ATP-binding protein [Rhizobiaceae bacterium]